MDHWPDNPVVRNCERTGWPDRKELKRIRCPVCGGESPESFYRSKNGEIIGCDYCVKIVDSYLTEGDC